LHGSSRHYHLKRRYGIGASEVEALIREQGGVCPICDRSDPEHVDHDHETGQVRGSYASIATADSVNSVTIPNGSTAPRSTSRTQSNVRLKSRDSSKRRASGRAPCEELRP